jgi:hypothetical protein
VVVVCVRGSIFAIINQLQMMLYAAESDRRDVFLSGIGAIEVMLTKLRLLVT